MNPPEMTQEEWLAYGIKHNYAYAPQCWAHGFTPVINGEIDWFDEGLDQCVTIVQLVGVDEYDLPQSTKSFMDMHVDAIEEERARDRG